VTVPELALLPALQAHPPSVLPSPCSDVCQNPRHSVAPPSTRPAPLPGLLRALWLLFGSLRHRLVAHARRLAEPSIGRRAKQAVLRICQATPVATAPLIRWVDRRPAEKSLAAVSGFANLPQEGSRSWSYRPAHQGPWRPRSNRTKQLCGQLGEASEGGNPLLGPSAFATARKPWPPEQQAARQRSITTTCAQLPSNRLGRPPFYLVSQSGPAALISS